MNNLLLLNIGAKLKGFALLLLAALCLSACGGGQQASSSSSEPQKTSSSSAASSNSSAQTSSSTSTSSSASVVSLQEKCITGFAPHATDGRLADQYAQYTENGQTDALLRPEIIQWMEDHAWQEGHFLWHEARRCRSGFGSGGGSSIDVCSFTQMLPEQDECQGPQDGYEFLVMHRHMISVLSQLWPSMHDQFNGWDQFPERDDYPPFLQTYFRQWNDQVLRAAEVADGIDQMSRDEVLQRWPDEGVFGQWIQCGTTTGGISLNGLHGALHFNAFPPSNQSHGVSNPRRNLDAYTFWKLHGWIDKAWEKYRVATGLSPDEPKLQAELLAQCQEHHFWSEQVDPSLTELEPETGGNQGSVFEELVLQAFSDGGCLGCHGSAQTAGLRLGGASAPELIAGLVNRSARNVQGYQLVVPGDPDSSWLYLKASGASLGVSANCSAGQSSCKQAMEGMSAEGLTALRQWIVDGATNQ